MCITDELTPVDPEFAHKDRTGLLWPSHSGNVDMCLRHNGPVKTYCIVGNKLGAYLLRICIPSGVSPEIYLAQLVGGYQCELW